MNSTIITIVDPASKRPAAFRIVKLLSKEPAGQREFGDPRVKQAIRSQLMDRREQLLKAAYYDIVHNESKIQNYYATDLLKNVQ